MFLWIFIVIFCIAYAFFSFLVIIGWKRVPQFKNGTTSHNTFISLIICCKNEEKHLPKLLESIRNQKYRNFELIIANDHSTDNSATILKQFTSPFATKIISTEKEGKKNALKQAIATSEGKLIVCTDADCILHPQHLQTIADFYEKEHAQMILGGVLLHPQINFFERLQALEFLSLIVSGAGMAGIKMPILCNGANLAFERDVWNENVLEDRTASGDDQFLLFYLKKQKAKICFLKSKESTVWTSPTPNLKSFFAQRTRWTSKSKYYTDIATILVALLIFCYSLLQIILLVATCINPEILSSLLVLSINKFVFDVLLLSSSLPFYQQKKLLLYSLPLSLCYPFYIVFTAIYGLCGKTKWKN